LDDSSEKKQLIRYFLKGISAVDPSRLVTDALRWDTFSVSLTVPWAPPLIPRNKLKRVFIVGGGKAGRAMGEAALGVLGDLVTEGVMAVPQGKGGTLGPLKFIEAAHPVPDLGSFIATSEILALLEKAEEGDLVIALLSGGGSSMISAPAKNITTEQKTDVSRLLLHVGADIYQFNTVRKHLSDVKGGLLARAAAPATVWALLLSDVPGDDPSVIASGPFTPDPTTYADAIGALEQYGIFYAVPTAVRCHLMDGAAERLPETPKPGDPVFLNVFQAIIGTNRTAIAAISETAKKSGAEVILLPGLLRGEARSCAKAFCDRMRKTAASLPPGSTAVLIAGGETTVYVWGDGKGGRSQEFALFSALELAGDNRFSLLAAGTDGVDGPTDAAGAYVDGLTVDRAKAAGLDPRAYLADNDSYTFFKKLGGLFVINPTGTNVADLVIGIARSTAD